MCQSTRNLFLVSFLCVTSPWPYKRLQHLHRKELIAMNMYLTRRLQQIAYPEADLGYDPWATSPIYDVWKLSTCVHYNCVALILKSITFVLLFMAEHVCYMTKHEDESSQKTSPMKRAPKNLMHCEQNCKSNFLTKSRKKVKCFLMESLSRRAFWTPLHWCNRRQRKHWRSCPSLEVP